MTRLCRWIPLSEAMLSFQEMIVDMSGSLGQIIAAPGLFLARLLLPHSNRLVVSLAVGLVGFPAMGFWLALQLVKTFLLRMSDGGKAQGGPALKQGAVSDVSSAARPPVPREGEAASRFSKEEGRAEGPETDLDGNAQADRWFQRAMAAVHADNWEEALIYLGNLLRVRPADYRAWTWRAKILGEQLCRWDEAAESFARARQIHPQEAVAAFNSGVAFYNAKRFAAAADAFEAAARLQHPKAAQMAERCRVELAPQSE